MSTSDMTLLRKALEPFARIWRINEPLSPSLDRGIRESVPELWPTMGDCKNAADVLAATKPK